jgi:hypothetical protein
MDGRTFKIQRDEAIALQRSADEIAHEYSDHEVGFLCATCLRMTIPYADNWPAFNRARHEFLNGHENHGAVWLTVEVQRGQRYQPVYQITRPN